MARPREFDRTKVIRQAMDVFWCKGYEATSINDLTEATDLNPGSLYNAFGNKHDLYLQALDYYNAHDGRCLFEVVEEPISGLQAIKKLFANLIELEFKDSPRRGCFMMNAVLERANADDDVAQRAYNAQTQSEAMFRELLARARDVGEISAELDLDKAAAFLLSLLYGVRSMAGAGGKRKALQDVVETALRALE